MPIHTFYEITRDGLKRRRETCPRCGTGVFLADHSDRLSCGRCGYTKFKKKTTKKA